MSGPCAHPRRAFTIIELMVAVTLILVIVGIAGAAFSQMLVLTRRTNAVAGMDARARAFYERFALEVSSIHPGAALWLKSTANPHSVELISMHGKMEPGDWSRTSTPVDYSTDTRWCMWRWTAPDGRPQEGVLRSGVNSSDRYFPLTDRDPWWNGDYTKYTGGYNQTQYLFLVSPELRRDPGAAFDPKTVLDANAWWTGSPFDKGDYTDMAWNLAPELENCSDFTIELQNADGSAPKTASGAVDMQWSAPGSFVDGGTLGRTRAAPGDRPCILRVRFTLSDPQTGVSSMYSFSFGTPGFTYY